MEVLKKEVDQEQAKRDAEKGPLTREQRRWSERINKEITEMIDRLVKQWYDVFLNNDPTSDAVREKAAEVSAKWKMYCHRRRLKPEAHDVVSKSITELMDEYKKLGGPERKAPVVQELPPPMSYPTKRPKGWMSFEFFNFFKK